LTSLPYLLYIGGKRALESPWADGLAACDEWW